MCCLLKRFTLALIVIPPSTICYASIELSAIDSGWYRNNGANSPANPNYIVQTNGTAQFRNYFVFDLTGVTNTILSATLRLENPQILNNGIASTYTLYDVSTDIASLVAAQSGATGVGIYGDLGTGGTYGSVALSSSVGVGIIELSLGTAAISAMNSASGLFAFGGTLSTTGTTAIQLFTGTSGPDYVRTLVLELEQPPTLPAGSLVPEPFSVVVWCGIAVVSSLGIIARRKLG